MVTEGNDAVPGKRTSAAGHDAAVIRVQLSNPAPVALAYRTRGAGADLRRLNPRTVRVWRAEDSCILFRAHNPRCVDDIGLLIGRPLPWKAGHLSDNHPDVPGNPARDTLFPFGFGLPY